MGRVLGSKNKNSKLGRLFTSTLPIEERLKIIANLVVDRLLEDQKLGKLPIKNVISKI